jgi:hypothetical protein
VSAASQGRSAEVEPLLAQARETFELLEANRNSSA